MTLHLKSPDVICMNRQSDLLMYSSGQKKVGGGWGYSSGTLYHKSKWKGRPPPPPMTSTQLNIPKSGCFFFAALHPLLQNGAFAPKWNNSFTCLDELMLYFKDFLFCYVRYYHLSLVTRKPVFGVFWPVKIQSGLFSYRC